MSVSIVPLSFVAQKSYHTTSPRRPIVLVYGLNIPRACRDYMTKSARYDFSVTKPRGTLDTEPNCSNRLKRDNNV